MAKYDDDLNTPAIAVVGLVSTILIVAIVLVLSVLYYRVEARLDYDKNISQVPTEVSNLLANQRILLTERRWINQQEGIIRIPISEAMDLVVAEYTTAERAAAGEEQSSLPDTMPAKTEQQADGQ